MMMPGHPSQLQPVHPMHGGPPLQSAPPPAQNTQQQSSNRQSASLVIKNYFSTRNGDKKIFFCLFCFLETKLHLEVYSRRSHEGGVGGEVQPQRRVAGKFL